MRHLLAFSISILLCLSGFSQYPEIPIDSCDFDAEPCSFMVPIDSQSIWEIGVPSKSFLDAAHSPFNALISDDSLPYPGNLNDYVEFTLPISEIAELGICYFGFWHKYEFDSLHDGGIIKLSFDSTEYLTIKEWMSSPPGYDTLFSYIDCYEGDCSCIYSMAGDEYGFTGISEGWVYTKIMVTLWTAVRLGRSQGQYFSETASVRFYIKSDSIDGGEDGWAIDDFEISAQFVGGDVEDIESRSLKLYPDPATTFLSVFSEDIHSRFFDVSIYNSNGSCKINLSNSFSADGNYRIDISSLSSGVYFVVINSGQQVLSSKLIVI